MPIHTGFLEKYLNKCLGSEKPESGVSIVSVYVESRGVNNPARASLVVRTSISIPVYIYWSDVTTWLPAEGHPNYTITEKAWKEGGQIYLQSTIEIKEMLLSQLTYYYDYEKEHLVYYLPMTADIRSGDGQYIYHQTFDIPEKESAQNFSQARFRVVDSPPASVKYDPDQELTLRWRFLSRDENEFTVWRTLFNGPTNGHDLNYTDQILYAEDFTHMYPEEVIKFDHINISKQVHFVGRLYLVTLKLTIKPVEEADEALYVIFLKSRRLLSWDKGINLRMSTRVLRQNVSSLMHGDVALALSYCNGNDVPVIDNVAYMGLQVDQENCVKCEAYGNMARDVILTKGAYLVRPSANNALVYSSYYPETRSIMYTYRKRINTDEGEFHCRAVLRNNRLVSRKFAVAWIGNELTLDGSILSVNQTEAEIECSTTADPAPELTVWRCEGETYCKLKSVAEQPGYELRMSVDDDGRRTASLVLRMPAATLKSEAILCRASNKFSTKEKWLLFDDRVKIEEADPEELPQTEPEGPIDVEVPDVRTTISDVGKSILDGDDEAGVDLIDDGFDVNAKAANTAPAQNDQIKDDAKALDTESESGLNNGNGLADNENKVDQRAAGESALEELDVSSSGDGEI